MITDRRLTVMDGNRVIGGFSLAEVVNCDTSNPLRVIITARCHLGFEHTEQDIPLRVWSPDD